METSTTALYIINNVQDQGRILVVSQYRLKLYEKFAGRRHNRISSYGQEDPSKETSLQCTLATLDFKANMYTDSSIVQRDMDYLKGPETLP